MTQEYNIFNLIGLKINTSNTKYTTYFANEYDKMNSGEVLKNTPVVEVIVGDLPEVIAGDIHGKKRFKKLFTFEYVVRRLDKNQTTIYFKQHFIDKIYINAIGVFLQAQVLEPVMYYKLLKNNVLFMHAAGVEKNNVGYLMPAYGGTGKTTLSLRLLSNGYRLLGDDLLLVDARNKQVHAYPRPFHLFTYNISSLEGASVPLKYRFIIRTKNILRYILEAITKEEFLISTRVHADELYEGDIWSTVAPYRKIVFLKKVGEHEVFSLKSKTECKKHAEKIIASADLNESLLENILTGKEEQKKFKRLEVNVVSTVLSSLDNITYINTRKLTNKEMLKTFETT